jgi:SAM-dependent methyltransferase
MHETFDRLRRPFGRWAYVMGLRRAEPTELDFGWASSWTRRPLYASLIALLGAVAIHASVRWWPVSLVLAILSASFFAGHLVAVHASSAEHIGLPMVDLLSGDKDLVLDAGCGAGRSTVALGRAIKGGRITAVDRFDSNYIDSGGLALLKRNLRLANLEDRVDIRKGDITHLPFPDNTFDSAVSTHVFDHLGREASRALGEVHRVLRPGGRFLMVVWVPSWHMFAIANVLSFMLTSTHRWTALSEAAGLSIIDRGFFNGYWFVLLEKPGQRNSTSRRPVRGPYASKHTPNDVADQPYPPRRVA